LKRVIIDGALGTVPPGKEDSKKEYRAQAATWFKSVEGGRELADKVFSLGLWPELKPHLLPFANAVRKAIGLADIQDVSM
jgi:hypothetical protein